MPNYCSITIIGHMGRDPETRYNANGDAVCNFSVAVKSWKDETSWFRVSAFKKSAEIIEKYVRKGDAVMVVGSMRERKWTDKDGNERTTWELNAERIVLMGGKKDAEDEPANPVPPKKAKPEAPGGEISDDIPF